MSNLERFLNSLVPFIVCLVILAAFSVEIFLAEKPCPLCYLQRVGMLGAASGFLLNLRFGVHISHYGLVLLSALFGGFTALRQILLHACPGFPTFGEPILGLSLYTWSFIVHVSFILAVTVLLFLFRREKSFEHNPMTRWEKGVSILFFLVILGNVLSSYYRCELGPCVE